MSTLLEIEEATKLLSPEEKQQLVAFVLSSLRLVNASPPVPRKFTAEQIQRWIEEDERGMQAFLEQK